MTVIRRAINQEVIDAAEDYGIMWNLVEVLRRVLMRIERTSDCPLCEGKGGRHYTDCPLTSLTHETLDSIREE